MSSYAKQFKQGMYALLMLITVFPLVSQANNQRSAIGTNTNEIQEYDTSVPFIDLMRAALPFEDARPWLTGKAVQLDRDGWPARLNGQIAGSRFLSNMPPQAIPAGNYTVFYDGQGEIQWGGDAKLVQRVQGRDIISLTPGNDGKYDGTLRIVKSNPNNYLRNIRIIPPGGICSNNQFRRVRGPQDCAGGQFQAFVHNYHTLIFNPDYLNYMKDFKSIRFMNAAGVSNNPQSKWHQRQKITDATWGGKQGNRGMPIEIQIALANRVNANPWFVIHHAADNEYIQRFAELVKRHLRRNLRPHIEYSNETWNWIFLQGNYVRDRGQALRLDADRNKAGYKYYAERSVDIFKIWERVFGGPKRLVRILAGWTINTQITEMILSHKNAYKHADAFAIAPYFFGDHQSIRIVRSLPETFALITDDKYRYSLNNVLKFIHNQKQVADKYGLELMAYEGGQGLVDFKTRHDMEMPNPLIYQANRHPRMAQFYQQFLSGWKRLNAGLFMHYSSPRAYRRYGAWGSKEYINQPLSQAPKHQALLNFMRSNPCWWRGCNR